jgi:hypothetical protein
LLRAAPKKILERTFREDHMSAGNQRHSTRAGHLTAGAKSPGSGQHLTRSATDLKRPLPQASLEKAKKTFANFSLSRFAKNPVPANYVDRLSVKDPAAVQTRQKALITQQLDKLPATNPQNPGMTLAFPLAKLQEIAKSLPGIGKDGGSIRLDDLLTYMRGKMNGADLYWSGNPVLRRLTVDTQLRSQAQAIIDSIKNRAADASTAEPALASKSATHALAPPSKGGSKP